MGFEQYNKMASNFGSSFKPEDDEIVEHEVTTRSLAEIRETGLVPVQKKEGEVIHDQEYIKQELKVDIELLGDVTETLRMDLKQGSKATEFLAFASLMKERREHLREYKDINKDIAEIERGFTGDTPGNGNTTITNNTVVLSGNEAFDMILAARDKQNGLDPNKEIR